MYRLLTFLIAIISCSNLNVSRLQALDETRRTFKLSNGSSLELRCLKENGFEWFESNDGFAVVKTPDRYEYAFSKEDGSLAASGVLAIGESKKLPFPSGIRPTAEFLRKKREEVAIPTPQTNPNPISVVQPDGTKLEVYLKGSGVYSWYEDKTGYSIVVVRGRMEYALRDPSGALIGSGIEVDSMKPMDAGLTAGIRPSVDFLRKYNSTR